MASPRKVGSLQQTLISNLASPTLISLRRTEISRKISQRLNGMNKSKNQRAVELKKSHLSKMTRQKTIICQTLGKSRSQKRNQKGKLRRSRKTNTKKIRILKLSWIQSREKRRENNRQMKVKNKKFKKSQSLILSSISRNNLRYLLNQLCPNKLTCPRCLK